MPPCFSREGEAFAFMCSYSLSVVSPNTRAVVLINSALSCFLLSDCFLQ